MEKYFPQVEPVIVKAKEAEVNTILCAGFNHESNTCSLELGKKYCEIKICLGLLPLESLRPEERDTTVEKEIVFISEHAKEIIAIGEIGMDFHHAGKETGEEQSKQLRQLLDLAVKLDKPVVIHSRKAEKEVLEVLKDYPKLKKLIHCFGGKISLVKEYLKLGCMFSLPTTIVKSSHFEALAKEIPVDKLFLETDSPYLSPFKDIRNEPAFVVEGYKKLAELKGMNLDELQRQVYMNYQRMFG